MYNILVVDDEKWIRKGIVKKIDSHSKWISRIDEAEDGLDALNKIEKIKYDIILTDVKMPTIDGLELARTVKKTFPNMHLVIISGYDEFHYVQQAIKIGVNDYLLKPVNEEELNDLLKKIINKIRNDRERNHIENTIYQLMIAPTQQEYNFHELIKKQYDSENVTIIILFLEDKSIYKKEDIKKLGNQSNQLLILNEKKHRIDLLLISDVEDNARFIIRRLNRYIDNTNIKYYMFEHTLNKVEFKDIHTTYNTINDQLKYIKVNQYNTCICSKSIIMDCTSDTYLFERQHNIINQIKSCNKNKVISEINKTLDYICSKKGLVHKNIKQVIVKLTYEMIQFTGSLESVEDELMDTGYTIISEIDECIFIRHIFEKIKNYACYIIDRMGKEEVLAIEESIEEIINYIKNHYYEDISLNTIEKKYYINASYFSHMFKKITGENFSSYLMKIRLDAAKKLLINSELKVSKVTERVGYTDSKHFSKLFKKYVGIPPIQYRKKYSNHA